jgi:hypothetical protein
MKFILKAIECTYLILTLIGMAHAKEWRGIVPLHSTRADVERLLGKPQLDRVETAHYELGAERVMIIYITKRCEGATDGWRVPAGTVAGVWVSYPGERPKFASLKLNETKYNKVQEGDYLDVVTYRNDEEGIAYDVNEPMGSVDLVRYYPSAKDNNYLRCPAPPDPDDGIADSRKFDSYSQIHPDEEKRRLDNFATQLSSEPYARGYIIVYARRRTAARSVNGLAECAADYLVKIRGVEKGRIVMKFGGYRDRVETELWIRPNGWRAPETARGKPDIRESQARGKRKGSQTKCKL